MKIIFQIITLLIFICIINISAAINSNEEITVVIDYGNAKETQVMKLKWSSEMTALEALQRVATVETHPVGKYIIVTAINGINGVRGYKGWYYTLNDKSTGMVAFSQIVNKGDTIRWIYKEDVCSKTVDSIKCKEPK